MTPNQIIQILGIFFSVPIFVVILIMLFEVLTNIDDGEYKKAAFTLAICVVLAVIILAVIIAVF